jgi:hypothetical protein
MNIKLKTDGKVSQTIFWNLPDSIIRTVNGYVNIIETRELGPVLSKYCLLLVQ